jgi:hypothetical protein
MNSSMITAVMVLLVSAAALAQPMQAQAGVAEGARVRVSTDHSPGLPRRIAGTLTNVTPETLVVSTGVQEIRIGRERVRRMELSAGRRHPGAGMLRGAGFGLLAGAGAGAVAGYATHEESFLSSTPAASAAWGALAGALIGVPVGAIIGVAVPGERWYMVEQSRVSVTPHGRGAALRANVALP